jgi:hypothetical protein
VIDPDLVPDPGPIGSDLSPHKFAPAAFKVSGRPSDAARRQNLPMHWHVTRIAYYNSVGFLYDTEFCEEVDRAYSSAFIAIPWLMLITAYMLH